MTIATPERYAQMLDAARSGGYAYPAINVTSTQTLNAALQGFAEAGSDGIIQVSVGAASYLSGQAVQDRVAGSLAFAGFARQIAGHYPGITIALHTDHCAEPYLGEWVEPLLTYEAEQVQRGEEPAFQSHMWDGSALPLGRNLDIAERLMSLSRQAHTILEIEIGAVGGEEDGHIAGIDEKLYSTPEEGIEVARRLGLGERGRYMAAFTFGNVHGAYKPGVVKLRPELLGEIQQAVAQAVDDGSIGKSKTEDGPAVGEACPQLDARNTIGDGSGASAGADGEPASADVGMATTADFQHDCIPAFPENKPFELVFHGGSGSTDDEIREAVKYGVVKMNIDTDTQYAFTRAVAGHMFEHYDSVLKIDGEMGDKQYYDPRSWGVEAEKAMAERVVEACKVLGSAGKALK